jgi:hypothetical protein
MGVALRERVRALMLQIAWTRSASGSAVTYPSEMGVPTTVESMMADVMETRARSS